MGEPMKKYIVTSILVLMGVQITMAESFSQLWRQWKVAQRKDQPKTEMKWLRKIVAKATAEKEYGHLIKAQVLLSNINVMVSPDSLSVETKRLEALAADSSSVLGAIYANLLGHFYKNLNERDTSLWQPWFDRSMAKPTLLAAEHDSHFTPSLNIGIDSKIFGHDLLHVLGFEAEAWKIMHQVYSAQGNRPATCIVALNQLKDRYRKSTPTTTYLHQLDSLIQVYGDLPVAGEVANERCKVMEDDVEGDNDKVEQQYNFIRYALSRWGSWPTTSYLRSRLEDITRPFYSFSLSTEQILPMQAHSVAINSVRHIDELTLRVYKLRVNGNTSLDPEEDIKKIKKLMTPVPVQTITRKYIGQPEWKILEDSVTLQPLPVGIYLLESSSNLNKMKKQYALLHVSDVTLLQLPLPHKRVKQVVVSSETGKPWSQARILATVKKFSNPTSVSSDTDVTEALLDEELDSAVVDSVAVDDVYEEEEDNDKEKFLTLITDSLGQVVINETNQKYTSLWPYTAKDKSAVQIRQSYSPSYSYYSNRSSQSRVRLFTDRSIYRPGQTVHVMALAYTQDDKNMRARPDSARQLKLSLLDANGKEVEQQTSTTDAFGTLALSFTLPSVGLTGRYRIQMQEQPYASVSIQVEQYKRPTFAVTFDPYKGHYQLGDTVSLRGVAKTYSGVPVANAQVHYTVTRHPSFYWRWNNTLQRQISSGTVTTDENGAFTVSAPMIAADETDRKLPFYYSMVVEARVTDGTGETREASTSLPLSNRSSFLRTNLPAKVLSDSLRAFTIERRNLMDEPLEGNIRYRWDGGQWQESKAQQSIQIDKVFSSGVHHFEAVCEGDTVRQDVLVFSLHDKRPPIVTHDWFYLSSETFPANGQPVHLQVGTSDEATIYYAIFSADSLLAQGVKQLNNEVLTYPLHYKENWGDGVTIALAWVNGGKMYSHTVQVRKPLPQQELRVSWLTFRDRLTPGQKEEWTLRVEQPDGRPARAQLLATLYDKSLEAILPHSWYFSIPFSRALPWTRWATQDFSSLNLYSELASSVLGRNELLFSHFDVQLSPYYFFDRNEANALYETVEVKGYSSKRVKFTAPVVKRDAMTKRMVKIETSVMANSDAAPAAQENSEEADESKKNDAAAPQLRENLEETAFFQPQLLSDAEGKVNIRFTLPQSVTTWRFMALAHDKEMRYGQMTSEVVASKKVMVQPHLPRFVRQGDKATLSARVANTTGETVSGVARLIIIDPETDKTVLEERKNIMLEANKNAFVDWQVDAARLQRKQSNALYIVRVMIEGKDWSDGEQHWLPVLPVTEPTLTTLPLTVLQKGKTEVNLGDLLPQSVHRPRLTVEWTDQSAWVALQALPTVATPTDKDAFATAAALYANLIGQNMVASSPRLQQSIEIWSKTANSTGVLTSALAKNEDLKQMVLSETPWVADANDETRQREQLTQFLSSSTLTARITEQTTRLGQLQHSDGSFSWWPGMPGNAATTMSVATILTRLRSMIATKIPAELLLIQQKAMGYMEKSVAKEVKEMKKAEKEVNQKFAPSELACQFLYASALDNRPRTSDIDYLVDRLSRIPAELTIFGKARSAFILAHYGKTVQAADYLKSLQEYAVYKENMGRYFDTPNAYYSWRDYRIPTQVAAIEALRILAPKDSVTVNQMLQWVLQSKRTQAWDTPINTVDAVSALLTNGKGKVSVTPATENTAVQMMVDGKSLTLPESTAALGYVRSVLPTDGKHLTINKRSSGMSWGGVYALYWQKSDEAKAQVNGLKVTRQIIDELTGKPLSGNHIALHVGDKVRVRITIVADRDYDFVTVEDKRAACFEPFNPISGYHGGCYVALQDQSTRYFFDQMRKGRHVVETTYFVDRKGEYKSGLCTAQCAYAPEFSGRDAALFITVNEDLR